MEMFTKNPITGKEYFHGFENERNTTRHETIKEEKVMTNEEKCNLTFNDSDWCEYWGIYDDDDAEDE